MLLSAGLLGLFITGLLASTLLPLASEPVLIAYLLADPMASRWAPVIAIGLGNTLGGVVTYMMGRGVRVLWQKWRPDVGTNTASVTSSEGKVARKARQVVEKYGAFTLIFSWLPVVGDPLCLVAGSLKLSVWRCVFWIAVGKFGRYATLAWLMPVA